MTSRSSRRRPQLALRARHGLSEIEFEARDRYAIGAVVLLLIAVTVGVVLVVG